MHFYIFIKLLLYIVICMDIAQASFRVTHSPAMPHEGRVRRGFSAVPERANREPRTAKVGLDRGAAGAAPGAGRARAGERGRRPTRAAFINNY